MSALLIVNSRLCERAVRAFICQMIVIMGLVFGALLDTSTAGASDQCDAAATEFLRSPSASSLETLKNADAESCWNSIGTANEKLQAINALVSNGNHSAAQYLASHLKRLGGGNLEDALIALGQFSEKDMAGFLELTRAHVLTSRESSDALTMLPLSMTDEPKTQLAAMERRRAAATLVSQKSLEKCKGIALAEIDQFVTEIKRSQ